MNVDGNEEGTSGEKMNFNTNPEASPNDNGENQLEASANILTEEKPAEHLNANINGEGENKPEANVKIAKEAEAAAGGCSKAAVDRDGAIVSHELDASHNKFVSTEWSIKQRKPNVIRVESETSLKCDGCRWWFRERFQQNNHREIHSEEQPFICTSCKTAFLHKDGIYVLLNSINDTKSNFACGIPEKTFEFPEINFACSIPEETIEFTDPSLACGTSKETVERTEPNVSCGISEESVEPEENLKELTETQSQKEYICHTCGNVYRHSRTLYRHIFLHKEIKHFHCMYCEYSSHDSSNLRKHLMAKHPEKINV